MIKKINKTKNLVINLDGREGNTYNIIKSVKNLIKNTGQFRDVANLFIYQGGYNYYEIIGIVDYHLSDFVEFQTENTDLINSVEKAMRDIEEIPEFYVSEETEYFDDAVNFSKGLSGDLLCKFYRNNGVLKCNFEGTVWISNLRNSPFPFLTERFSGKLKCDLALSIEEYEELNLPKKIDVSSVTGQFKDGFLEFLDQKEIQSRKLEEESGKTEMRLM